MVVGRDKLVRSLGSVPDRDVSGCKFLSVLDLYIFKATSIPPPSGIALQWTPTKNWLYMRIWVMLVTASRIPHVSRHPEPQRFDSR
jgi:hypothetical protein